MAILEMQKIRLLAHKDNAEDIVDIIQKHGVLEIKESEVPGNIHTKNDFRNRLPVVEGVVEFLEEHRENKKSPFSKKPVLTEEYCREVLYEFDYGDVMERADELREKIKNTKQSIKDLSAIKEILFFWDDLPFAVPGDLRTEYTKTTLFTFADTQEEKQEPYDILKKEKIAAEIFFSKKGGIAVTHLIEDEDNVLKIFKKEGFEEAGAYTWFYGSDVGDLNGIVPAKALKKLTRSTKESESDLDNLEEEARKLSSKYLSVFLVLRDLMIWEKDKEEALESVESTDAVLVIEGWCPKKKLDALSGAIEEKTKIFAIKKIKPKEGEMPPVEIDNPSIFKPLESVTRLYGLPGYRDIDPTMYLAVFFVISFGLALTDLGYGIFLMLTSFAAIKIFRLVGIAKLYMNTLFAGGAAASFFGLLTGGFLGIDPAYFPAFVSSLQRLDIIENPLPVFYFSLAIGVVQVFFGMILKIVREYKNKNLIEGVATQGPWLLAFLSIILYGASLAGYAENFSNIFLWMIYASLAAVALSGVVMGKTISGRISKSLGGLYNGIGYFSDILSYSRLFALGLATTALAFSVNLIAMIIIEGVPVVGYVIAGIVLIVGHLFNIVVNTLGAFIHSARLQFVEFFGKFIEGTGKQFKPLERKSTFVVLEDK